MLTKPFASPEQANLVLAEVGAPLQVALAQAREFALVRTTVTGAVTGVDLDAFADAELVQALGGAVPLAGRVTPEQLAAGFGLTVGFTLPGEVVAANGTVDQGTVSWQPSMAPGAVTPLQAAAELRDEGALAAREPGVVGPTGPLGVGRARGPRGGGRRDRVVDPAPPSPPCPPTVIESRNSAHPERIP